MNSKKRILVAPLNWGLGHATRCIPIINALLDEGYQPILASDGMALDLLRLEFPKLEWVELPAYGITYSKKGKNLRFKLLIDSPKVLKAINSEKKQIDKLVGEKQIQGIISDNRLGVYSKKTPSAIITHQLQVLSKSTTWFSSKLHQHFIKKFDECWVPDTKNEPSLSGKLGHIKNPIISTKYLGIISRFNHFGCEITYDLLVLLSGPEPQRSIFEDLLLVELKNYNGRILFIRGVVEPKQSVVKNDNMTIINYLESTALEEALNKSNMVLSRSGYTTILDLAKLGKKAFFVPTPGQFEQEYLAKRLDEKGIIPYSAQENFTIKKLDELKNYIGFQGYSTHTKMHILFDLFEGERKLTTDTKFTFNV